MVQTTDQKNLKRVKAVKTPLVNRSKKSHLGYNFRGGSRSYFYSPDLLPLYPDQNTPVPAKKKGCE